MNHAVTTVRGQTLSITGPDAPSEARRLAQAAEFQAQTDRLNAAHIQMWKGMQAAQTNMGLDDAFYAKRAEHEDQPDGPGPLVAAGAIAAGVAIVASFIAGFIAGFSYQFFLG